MSLRQIVLERRLLLQFVQRLRSYSTSQRDTTPPIATDVSNNAKQKEKLAKEATVPSKGECAVQPQRLPFVKSSSRDSSRVTEVGKQAQHPAKAPRVALPERLSQQSFPVQQSSVAVPTSDYNDFFGRVLQRFPKEGRSLSFAYGSGVFQQAGRSEKGNVTDLILAVDDPKEWHASNLKMNKTDYAGIFRLLGPNFTAESQDSWGARLHFNTLIPFEDGLIKYGVMSSSALLNDCLDWEHMYVAGRLHKPARILEMDPGRDKELTTTLRMNLQSALHTALLLLPETFTEENLYLTLAGLSYNGDFRMIIGEDKNKVSNIVRPSISRFRQLYARRLRSMSDYVEVLPSKGHGDQDGSASGRHFHLTQLPRALQWNLVMEWNRDGRYRDVEEVLRSAAYDRDSDDLIHRALRRIVFRSSVTQAAKGILTAGLSKTLKYSFAKLGKMYQGFRRNR